MAQRLESAFKYVQASIDDFYRHATPCAESYAKYDSRFGGHPGGATPDFFFQQKVFKLYKLEDETACDAVLVLQVDVAHCQANVQVRL